MAKKKKKEQESCRKKKYNKIMFVKHLPILFSCVLLYLCKVIHGKAVNAILLPSSKHRPYYCILCAMCVRRARIPSKKNMQRRTVIMPFWSGIYCHNAFGWCQIGTNVCFMALLWMELLKSQQFDDWLWQIFILFGLIWLLGFFLTLEQSNPIHSSQSISVVGKSKNIPFVNWLS